MSSVYARLTICTLFNSRKYQVVMEMAANGIVNNSIPLVAISDDLEFLNNDGSKWYFIFFANSTVFAQVCCIAANTTRAQYRNKSTL